MSVSRLLFVTLLLLATGVVGATDAWFEKISSAVRTTNYSGVLVYSHGEQMSSTRIFHRYADGKEQERVIALTGEPMEIHRNDDMVSCVLPAKQAVMIDQRGYKGALPPIARIAAAELEKHYLVSEMPQSRVVGRQCRAYSVMPRDEYRYGYRMWVDEQTMLPLKIELLDTQGNTLEKVMFTEVQYPEDIPDTAFEPDMDVSGFKKVRHSMPDSQQRPVKWQVSKLPPGFSVMTHQVQMMPEVDGAVEHLLFSDGLATVSAFITMEKPKTDGFIGPASMGAVNVYSDMRDGHQITVVGEVPEMTIDFIGRHLIPSAP